MFRRYKNSFWLLLFLGVLLLFSSATFAQPQYNPFTDLPPSNPYFDDIQALYRKGLLSGYPDGTFRPEQLISRAEFVKLVLGAGQCVDCSQPPVEIKNAYTTDPFPDVGKSAWYFYCVAHGKKTGLITGYLGQTKQGLFVPEDAISRAESIAVLLRATGIAPSDNDPVLLHDVLDSAWYKGYIKSALAIGLLEYHQGFVAPEEKISRAEFAHMVNTVMNQQQCREIQKGPADTDGDGVTDSEDACPAVAGVREFQGCPAGPDRDSDTIPDTFDRCPDQAGPVANQGCPEIFNGNGNGSGSISDQDRDGVPDQDDLCPTIPGPVSNRGCPDAANQNGNVNLNGNGSDTNSNTNRSPSNQNLNRNGSSLNNNQNGGIANQNLNRNGNVNNNRNQNGNENRNRNVNGGGNNNNTNGSQNDRDDDGVPDDQDDCPDVPGNLNNARMVRGCPVVDGDVPQEITPGIFVTPPACNMCPCPSVDYQADLRPGDVVFSIISNDNNQTIYTKSNLYYIKE